MRYQLLLVGLFLFLVSCNTDREIYSTHYEKKFSSGQRIHVVRNDVIAEHTGIFTGHKYGNTYSFTYEFTLTPGKVTWEGRTGETPRNLLLRKKNIYLRTTSKELMWTHPDSTSEPDDKEVMVVSSFYKYVDKRSLFKLMGKAYWTEVSDTVYHEEKAKSTEVEIPFHVPKKPAPKEEQE